jgi:hypothetical protein
LGLKIAAPSNQLRDSSVKITARLVDGKVDDMKLGGGKQHGQLLQNGGHGGANLQQLRADESNNHVACAPCCQLFRSLDFADVLFW